MPLKVQYTVVYYKDVGKEEETDRREGKGRRCCFGDGIQSIPCRTLDLAPG